MGGPLASRYLGPHRRAGDVRVRRSPLRPADGRLRRARAVVDAALLRAGPLDPRRHLRDGRTGDGVRRPGGGRLRPRRARTDVDRRALAVARHGGWWGSWSASRDASGGLLGAGVPVARRRRRSWAAGSRVDVEAVARRARGHGGRGLAGARRGRRGPRRAGHRVARDPRLEPVGGRHAPRPGQVPDVRFLHRRDRPRPRAVERVPAVRVRPPAPRGPRQDRSDRRAGELGPPRGLGRVDDRSRRARLSRRPHGSGGVLRSGALRGGLRCGHPATSRSGEPARRSRSGWARSSWPPCFITTSTSSRRRPTRPSG